MMTFVQFTKFVDALNSFYARQEQFDAALEPFNSSYTIMEFCPEITNVIFDFIKEDFNDVGEWFTYWYFELDKGKGWTPESCTEADGTPIVIKTTENIYDYLVKCKETE